MGHVRKSARGKILLISYFKTLELITIKAITRTFLLNVFFTKLKEMYFSVSRNSFLAALENGRTAILGSSVKNKTHRLACLQIISFQYKAVEYPRMTAVQAFAVMFPQYKQRNSRVTCTLLLFILQATQSYLKGKDWRLLIFLYFSSEDCWHDIFLL